jgi:hypothetical protein
LPAPQKIAGFGVVKRIHFVHAHPRQLGFQSPKLTQKRRSVPEAQLYFGLAARCLDFAAARFPQTLFAPRRHRG